MSLRVRSSLPSSGFERSAHHVPFPTVGGKGTLVRSIRSTRPGGQVWIIGCVPFHSTLSRLDLALVDLTFLFR